MTAAELADDWTMTHELVHMAFPSLPDDNHWMEEGQATYIEPVARVMTGELKAEDIWRDMVRDMPKGEPQGADDQGVDHTHTWARTYWGGALFCLVADVEIRRETNNRKGLRDALRAVVAAGRNDRSRTGICRGRWRSATKLQERRCCRACTRVGRTSPCKWICRSCGKNWEFDRRPTVELSLSQRRRWRRSARQSLRLETETRCRPEIRYEIGQANSQRRAMRRATTKSTMPTARRTDTCGHRAVTGRSRQKTLVKPSMAQALMVNMPAFCMVSGIR